MQQGSQNQSNRKWRKERKIFIAVPAQPMPAHRRVRSPLRRHPIQRSSMHATEIPGAGLRQFQ